MLTLSAAAVLLAVGVLAWPPGDRESGRWPRMPRLGRHRWGRGGGPPGSLDEVAELVAVGLEAGLSLVESAGVLAQLKFDAAQQAALQAILEVVDEASQPRQESQALEGRCTQAASWDPAQPRELGFVLAAAELSARSGAPLSAALRLAAEVARAEQAARERQHVLLAGPRASMLLLTLLPVAGPFLAWSLGWQPLAQRPATYGLMAAGGLATAIGWLWSRRLVRQAGRVTSLAPDPQRSAEPATVLDVARAIDLMPLALLTGCGSTEALEAVAQVVDGRVAADLRVVVAARRWGDEPGREWEVAGAAWAPVAIAWRTADQAGAAPAGLLAATASRIRRAEATRMEARIQRAGVLLVLPLGLCFLPGFLLTTVVPVVADLVSHLL